MKPNLNNRLLLPFAALALILASCERDGWKNIRGTGPVYSETRDVPIHRDVTVSIPADVYILQSQQKDLTIEAQANVLDAIDTYVSGSELKIKLMNGAGLGRHERIKIYISSALFNTIRLSGSVNLYSDNTIVTDVFDISISGSGETDVAVIANTVYASISGSGKMWFEGSAISQIFTISGSGDMYAFGMPCKTADINISGSGKTESTVEDFLKARISGSGNIYYKGYPVIDSHISGTGSVIHVN